MTVAIVLAAGRSARMGSPKQLLPAGDGVTIIESVVGQLGASRVEEIVVVLGFRAEETAGVLRETCARVVVNGAFELGMTCSICCGIRAARDADSYLICLGDQPVIPPAVVDAILETAQSSGAGIVVPTYDGGGGHPVFIQGRYGDEVLQLGPDEGLNMFVRRHTQDTVRLEVDDKSVVEDMDTPSDYERFITSRRERGSQ